MIIGVSLLRSIPFAGYLFSWLLLISPLCQCNTLSERNLLDFFHELQKNYRDQVYDFPFQLSLGTIGTHFYHAFLSGSYLNHTQNIPVLLFSRMLHSETSFGNNIAYYFEVGFPYDSG